MKVSTSRLSHILREQGVSVSVPIKWLSKETYQNPGSWYFYDASCPAGCCDCEIEASEVFTLLEEDGGGELLANLIRLRGCFAP